MNPPAGNSTPDWLRQRAQSTPERVALISADGSLTFRELDQAVDEMTSELAVMGVKAGGVVAVLSWNSAPFVAVVHAAARLGAVLLPLNARLSADELGWQIKDAGAAFLLHDEANTMVAEGLAAVAGRPLKLLGLGSPFEGLRMSGVRAVSDSSMTARRQRTERRFDLSEVQTILYTSGTTGRAKGAMLTYGNHLWSAVGSALNLGVQTDDRWLACLPLFHAGGLSILHRSVIYGIGCVLHESFEPARVNKAIDEDGVTIVSVVALMLEQMLDERGENPYPASLRCVLLGGGPAPRPLLERCAALGVPVVQTYGLTETASQATTLAPEEALSKLGSAGKPLFGTEVRVLRDDGAEAGPEEPGEIVVRGPAVTVGYLGQPKATSRALRGGWLHTGDIGYLDAEGYLYVLDRRDDLIISGGENVYPAEVEAALQSHPAVAEAGVIGVADERWGQAPLAVVVARKGVVVSDEELLSFCRERLAGYKTPKRIVLAEALARTAAGKLMRGELRQRYG
ncbi:MAG: o-succinylbenzoate--CoA ligase [Kiloniellaceae bacterium]|nr:o-succinylbenzoate--CoA ligase [Kiloniellaceae bacterium]MPZ48865.1 o-succinylbenzoate--CoA ligase [Dehalococcoidia bacterium]